MNSFRSNFEKNICEHFQLRLLTNDSKMVRVKGSSDIVCNYVLHAVVEGASHFLDNVYVIYTKDGIYKESKFDKLTTSKRWTQEYNGIEGGIVSSCVECSHLSLATLVSRIKSFVRQSAIKNESLVQEYIKYFRIGENFDFSVEIANKDEISDYYHLSLTDGDTKLSRVYTVKYNEVGDGSKYGTVMESTWWSIDNTLLTNEEMCDILSSLNSDMETLNTHTVMFLFRNIEQKCKE